jgi:DNA-binding NarL/FixJ family response regulator
MSALQEPLTRRERQVVELLHMGYDPAEIAPRLGIALKTVRNHIENIAKKAPGDPPPIRRIRRDGARWLLAG